MDGLQPVGNSLKGDASGGKQDLDAIVRAAVSKTMNPGSEPEAAATATEPEPSSPAPDQGKTDPAPDAAADVTEAPEAPESSEAPSGQAKPKAADEATLEAPKPWPKEQRDAFASLPDEAKRLILAREKSHNSAFTKNAQDNAAHRRFADDVRSLFTSDARDRLQAQGMNEVEALRRMIAFQENLGRNPAEGIKTLVKNFGLRPEQIFGSAPAPAAQQATPEEEEFVDPTVKALQEELGQVKTFLSSAFQQQQQQTLISLEQEVNAFETATDETGNPKYPHFEAVFDTMMQVLKHHPELAAMPATQGRQKLEKAYEMAVYLHPEVRQQLYDAEISRREEALRKQIAEQAAQEAAARQEKAAQEAAARARLAGTRKGSPGANGSAVPNQRMTLDDAVKAGWASIRK